MECKRKAWKREDREGDVLRGKDVQGANERRLRKRDEF